MRDQHQLPHFTFFFSSKYQYTPLFLYDKHYIVIVILQRVYLKRHLQTTAAHAEGHRVHVHVVGQRRIQTVLVAADTEQIFFERTLRIFVFKYCKIINKP